MAEHILIVDDDSLWRERIRTRLDDLGYVLLEASSVKEAYNYIEQVKRGILQISLVILDLNLPEYPGAGGGLSILLYLKECGCDIPCVILTAYDFHIDEVARLFKDYSNIVDEFWKFRGLHQLTEVVKRALEHKGPVIENANNDTNWDDLRVSLMKKLDDVEFEAFCLGHFSRVYNKFSSGMRRDQKINLLLDYCRRFPEELWKLFSLLGE